jgi:hypothetical protein
VRVKFTCSGIAEAHPAAAHVTGETTMLTMLGLLAIAAILAGLAPLIALRA